MATKKSVLPTVVAAISAAWEDVYHANLLSAYLADGKELINHTFQIADPEDYLITNPAREFRLEFSKMMADWIMSGQTEISQEMIDMNPNAAKYETIFELGNGMQTTTAYGPRILAQLEYVVRELRRFPESRRACIMLLADYDQQVADAIAEGTTKCEYICTFGYTFRINSAGTLDVITTMRSNNYTTTVCQDVYVVHQLWKRVAEELGLERGVYYHSSVSAHVFPGEEAKAERILDSYIESLQKVKVPAAFTKAIKQYEALKAERLAAE